MGDTDIKLCDLAFDVVDTACKHDKAKLEMARFICNSLLTSDGTTIVKTVFETLESQVLLKKNVNPGLYRKRTTNRFYRTIIVIALRLFIRAACIFESTVEQLEERLCDLDYVHVEDAASKVEKMIRWSDNVHVRPNLERLAYSLLPGKAVKDVGYATVDIDTQLSDAMFLEMEGRHFRAFLDREIVKYSNNANAADFMEVSGQDRAIIIKQPAESEELKPQAEITEPIQQKKLSTRLPQTNNGGGDNDTGGSISADKVKELDDNNMVAISREEGDNKDDDGPTARCYTPTITSTEQTVNDDDEDEDDLLTVTSDDMETEIGIAFISGEGDDSNDSIDEEENTDKDESNRNDDKESNKDEDIVETPSSKRPPKWSGNKKRKIKKCKIQPSSQDNPANRGDEHRVFLPLIKPASSLTLYFEYKLSQRLLKKFFFDRYRKTATIWAAKQEVKKKHEVHNYFTVINVGKDICALLQNDLIQLKTIPGIKDHPRKFIRNVFDRVHLDPNPDEPRGRYMYPLNDHEWLKEKCPGLSQSLGIISLCMRNHCKRMKGCSLLVSRPHCGEQLFHTDYVVDNASKDYSWSDEEMAFSGLISLQNDTKIDVSLKDEVTTVRLDVGEVIFMCGNLKHRGCNYEADNYRVFFYCESDAWKAPDNDVFLPDKLDS